MKNEFSIYKGQIKFIDHEILINDGIFKWHRTLRMVYSSFFIISGIWIAIKNLNNERILLIILGLVFFVFGIFGIISSLRVNTNTKLDLRQVEKALISRDLSSSLNLTLFLKNSQKRIILLDYREEDKFWDLHISNLVSTLEGLNINTETI